jgi:hypothetical protein
MNLLTKLCFRCKETKPLDEFVKNKSEKSGFSSECKICKAKRKAAYDETPIGRSKRLICAIIHSKNGKRKNLEKTLTYENILPILEAGKCQLTGLPFDFKPAKNTYRNPRSPSIDRIDSQKGYFPDNVRVVLCSVNEALGEYEDDVMLPILEAMVKGIKKNAKQKPTTPIPKRPDSESEHDAKHRTVSAAGLGENDNDSHHHCGTVQGQDSNHRTKACGGNCMGCGGKEVGTSLASQSLEDNGYSSTKNPWSLD